MPINLTDVALPSLIAGTAALSGIAGLLLGRKTPRRHTPDGLPPLRKHKVRTVVDDVQTQTEQAAALAQIPGQHRLTNPQTNPAVRAHADRLRDDQQRHLLDAEHRRMLRRYRVLDQRAARAEQALEVLLEARQARNPASSVLALHQGRRLYMGLTLGASVALSFGAAMSVAEFAAELGVPRWIGYSAEIGGTGLSTLAISYRAHLARHSGSVSGWWNRVLWLLTLGPLIASVITTLCGAGPVGVLCSIGSAAFALLGYVVGEASAKALADQADRVTSIDEAELRQIALGEELFTPPAVERPTLPDDHGLSDEQLVRLGYDAACVQQWLARHGIALEPQEVSRLLAASAEAEPSSSRQAQAARRHTPRDDKVTIRLPESGLETSEPSADLGALQVPDQSADLSSLQTPGPVLDQEPSQPSEQVPDQDLQQATTGRSRTRTRRRKRTDQELLEAALVADRAYLSEHGRHIPAEKLARTLSVRKATALHLTRTVRAQTARKEVGEPK